MRDIGPMVDSLRPPRSAYLHLPFCHRRCLYCDFPVVPLGDRADGGGGPGSASITAYLELLLGEIATAPSGPPLSTVYLGGGTPSLLIPAQVGDLLEALARRYGIAPGAELTMEMDPASFDQGRLEGYLATGINRVSLGGQSFDDAMLASLGRRHRREDLLEAAKWLDRARQRGALTSWSLDLIQGLPTGERRLPDGEGVLDHWRGQLRQAMALQAPHLSVYDLTVEPGTVYARRLQRGELDLPDEELSADLMDLTQQELTHWGYGRYEVSNYALPGHASRHNRVYWSGGGWWGFGMGATSAPWGHRVARPRTREGYAVWLRKEDVCGDERPGDGIPLDEQLIVGLRRREGVNVASLASRHGIGHADLEDLQRRLASFQRLGLLLIEGSRWRLSDPAGLALSNGVLREMLAWWETVPPPSTVGGRSIGAGHQRPARGHRSGEG